MKLAILTAGSRGDVQPYISLGRGLRDAGVDVRLATHVGFRELVERHGLEFAEVAHPSELLTADPAWEALQRTGDTAPRYVRRVAGVMRMIQPLLATMLDDFWAACQGADAVVGSMSAIGAPQQAVALGVPHCWALVQPMSPTSEYPHFLTPGHLHVPRRLNFRTHVVAERVRWRLFRSAEDRWTAANLGGMPTPKPKPGALFGGGGGPVVYGMSPTLVPPPSDWPPNIAQFGHWFLDALPGEALPADVEDFLAAGPAPVFVHAAQIGVAPPEKFVGMVVQALQRLGARGVVSGVEPGVLPESMLALPPVPFDVLFPCVAAVVHHGGAGTTATAVRAGVPSFGVPGSFDQAFWSARVAALGAGPPPVPARRMTEARLEAALRQLLRDPSNRERAAFLGGRLRRERGVEHAAEHLARLFAGERMEVIGA